jgi:hypothetical protein
VEVVLGVGDWIINRWYDVLCGLVVAIVLLVVLILLGWFKGAAARLTAHRKNKDC